jgi:hypothetical protein
MTPTSGDENPYQPPQDSLQASPGLPPLPKPNSTVLLAIGTSCWCALVIFMSCAKIIEVGFTVWLSGLVTTPIALFMILYPIVSAVVMIMARRNLFSYIVGSCTSLLWLLFVMLLLYPMYPLRSLDDFFTFLGFYAVMGSPFYLIFHRFTFGLPSRRYYGMAPAFQD